MKLTIDNENIYISHTLLPGTNHFAASWFVMDMSLRKTIFNKALAVKLTATDIFNTRNNDWSMDTYGITMNKYQSYDRRGITLSLYRQIYFSASGNDFCASLRLIRLRWLGVMSRKNETSLASKLANSGDYIAQSYEIFGNNLLNSKDYD